MRTLAALLFVTALLPAAEPNLTTEERQKLIALLEESKQQTLQSIEGLSPAQWTFKPAPERWSIGECVEHIMRSEVLLFKQAETALASPANPEWETKTKGKTEFLEKIMPARQGKATAPFEIRPEGKMTREEILKQYDELRSKSLAFARQVDKPLKAHTTEHPFPVFNTLNAHQWLLYIPWHNQRHIKQIEEVKAHADFPKN